MERMIVSASFPLAMLAAGMMGFAIQRGATCTVAAVDEILNTLSANRLWAMAEAALWVALGLSLAQRLHWLNAFPPGYAVSAWTLVGAVLLGFGAWVNQACVFGVIAKLGSGEWAYAATPVGYFFGCLSVEALFSPEPRSSLPSDTLMVGAANGALLPLIALLAWRVHKRFWRKHDPRDEKKRAHFESLLWSPHGSTVTIGLMFLATTLLVGTWAYTDVLAELAHGMSMRLHAGALMTVALLLGAMVGGYTAGRMRWYPISITAFARCFAGGVLMAWGSLLVPGGNDGLILIGMPLLWPYAWLAFFIMCVTVAAAPLTSVRFVTMRAAKSPTKF